MIELHIVVKLTQNNYHFSLVVCEVVCGSVFGYYEVVCPTEEANFTSIFYIILWSHLL